MLLRVFTYDSMKRDDINCLLFSTHVQRSTTELCYPFALESFVLTARLKYIPQNVNRKREFINFKN